MEMFYRVLSVDYSWYEETQEFDDEEEAIAYAERCWDEGEGGCTEVKVDRVEIDDDYSTEELTTIWERNTDMIIPLEPSDEPVDFLNPIEPII